jgi:Uma2 family endonuclease
LRSEYFRLFRRFSSVILRSHSRATDGAALMSTERARLQFTTDHIKKMLAAGILSEDDRVELIDGDLVAMSPIGSRHASCVNTLNYLLVTSLGPKAIVSVQNSVSLNLYNLAQPDIVVLRARQDRYWERLPKPADILLVIEVSDSSARYDKSVKIPLYARFGIREAWIVNLPDRLVEVYTQPRDGAYRSSTTIRPGETVQSARLTEVAFSADELLR